MHIFLILILVSCLGFSKVYYKEIRIPALVDGIFDLEFMETVVANAIPTENTAKDKLHCPDVGTKLKAILFLMSIALMNTSELKENRENAVLSFVHAIMNNDSWTNSAQCLTIIINGIVGKIPVRTS